MFHKPDPLTSTGWCTMTMRHIQVGGDCRVEHVCAHVSCILCSPLLSYDGCPDLACTRALLTWPAPPWPHNTVQGYTAFKVGSSLVNATLNATTVPALATAPLGTAIYNKTMTPDPWWYGNNTYNASALTVVIPGVLRHASTLWVQKQDCPPAGCSPIPEIVSGPLLGWLCFPMWKMHAQQCSASA